uniref:Uncharacterized protein n=1 Tax=Vespula pensylvanica TaxID=30213 RepID=A0A834JP06_VESPE|nr:hypothetical protein H0235_017774 [Vespula pensylvanica]
MGDGGPRLSAIKIIPFLPAAERKELTSTLTRVPPGSYLFLFVSPPTTTLLGPPLPLPRRPLAPFCGSSNSSSSASASSSSSSNSSQRFPTFQQTGRFAFAAFHSRVESSRGPR